MDIQLNMETSPHYKIIGQKAHESPSICTSVPPYMEHQSTFQGERRYEMVLDASNHTSNCLDSTGMGGQFSLRWARRLFPVMRNTAQINSFSFLRHNEEAADLRMESSVLISEFFQVITHNEGLLQGNYIFIWISRCGQTVFLYYGNSC